MVEVTFYAVRQISTGFYIPRPQRSDGRGGSFSEPFNFHNREENLIRRPKMSQHFVKTAQPRLFTEERAAKIFLTTWLKGRWKCYRSGSYDDYDEEVYIEKDPNRTVIDMEIVPVTVTLP